MKNKKTINNGSALMFLVAGISLLFSAPVVPQDTDDNMTEKLQKLLENKENNDKSDENSDSELEAIEKANRELHGGEDGPQKRKKKPAEILDDIVKAMGEAQHSLAENVRNMERIEALLKRYQKAGKRGADEKQKEIVKKIRKLFNESQSAQQESMKELEDIRSFRKRMSSAQNSQKQSMTSIERLIKMASKMKSGKSSGQKKRKNKKKKKQSGKRNQKQKSKSQQQKNSNNPANRAYESKTDSASAPKVRSGEASRWGELPPKVRDAMMQRQNEEFVPQYSDRVQEYYKKLGKDSE